MRTPGWILVAAATATACSSGYVPRTPGRVAVVMRGGQISYARDGRYYSHGFLGGGLADAVRGVPAAERAANEFHDRMRDGLLVSLGGIVCSSVALGLALNKSLEQNNDSVPVEAWVSLGCLAVSFAGLGYMITAAPYQWDAVNIFNDAAAAPVFVPSGPPGARLPSTRPRASLRMDR